MINNRMKRKRRKAPEVTAAEKVPILVNIDGGDVSEEESDFEPATKKSKKSEDRIECSLPRNISKIQELLAAADTCRLSNSDLTRILALLDRSEVVSESSCMCGDLYI